jgi:hypothetical protein
MLSSAAANGERFGLGRQPIGCERLHDLVFARARVKPKGGATPAARYSPNALWNPSRVRAAPTGRPAPCRSNGRACVGGMMMTLRTGRPGLARLRRERISRSLWVGTKPSCTTDSIVQQEDRVTNPYARPRTAPTPRGRATVPSRCLWREGLGLDECGVLAFELLGRARAPALGHRL